MENENFKKEKQPAPEYGEGHEYKGFQDAIDEEARIMREIERVFATVSDQNEAERIVLELWVPRIEEAMRESTKALRRWLNALTKANEISE